MEQQLFNADESGDTEANNNGLDCGRQLVPMDNGLIENKLTLLNPCEELTRNVSQATAGDVIP